jgi:hypothetical protein
MNSPVTSVLSNNFLIYQPLLIAGDKEQCCRYDFKLRFRLLTTKSARCFIERVFMSDFFVARGHSKTL